MEKKPKTPPEKKQRATSSLRRNANIKRDMRPDIERAVAMKMESLGVKAVSQRHYAIQYNLLNKCKRASPPPPPQDQRGLKQEQLSSVLAELHSRRQSFAKGKPDYWRQRKETAGAVEQKLSQRRMGSDPPPETPAASRRSLQGESSKRSSGFSRSGYRGDLRLNTAPGTDPPSPFFHLVCFKCRKTGPDPAAYPPERPR